MLVNIVTLVYINQTHKRHRDFLYIMIFKTVLWLFVRFETKILREKRSGLLILLYKRMKEFVITPLQLSALYYYNEQMMRPEAEFMNVQFR
jgi:hypothetical protein